MSLPGGSGPYSSTVPTWIRRTGHGSAAAAATSDSARRTFEACRVSSSCRQPSRAFAASTALTTSLMRWDRSRSASSSGVAAAASIGWKAHPVRWAAGARATASTGRPFRTREEHT